MTDEVSDEHEVSGDTDTGDDGSEPLNGLPMV